MAIYDAIGGMAGCGRLAAAFYARVERDPVVRPLYPKSLHCAVDAIAQFLAQQFGGPCEYSENRATLSLYESHLRFSIDQAARDAWLSDMMAAMDDVGIVEPARAEMARYFGQVSAYLINRPKANRVPGVLVMDDAVAALRRGDLERVSQLAEHPEFQRDRAAWVRLLGKMAASDAPRIVKYAMSRISADPGMAQERHGGALLRIASGEGCLAIIELLLRLGVDPNAVDRYGHPPLYFVGNQCRRQSAAAVIRTLVSAGADVNQQDRVKRCTPLHMAARRGNIGVAKALLECGADPGIPDRAGVTPLQRALNCRKAEVAALLSASSSSGPAYE